MHQDRRYEHALSAALVILDEFDTNPDMPKHKRLAVALYSILHAIDQWDLEGGKRRVGFSAN